MDDHDDLSEFTDGTDLSNVSILTESDLKRLEGQFEQKLGKLQGTIKAQNANYKDLEVQFQNKMKQQIQEFVSQSIPTGYIPPPGNPRENFFE